MDKIGVFRMDLEWNKSKSSNNFFSVKQYQYMLQDII